VPVENEPGKRSLAGRQLLFRRHLWIVSLTDDLGDQPQVLDEVTDAEQELNCQGRCPSFVAWPSSVLTMGIAGEDGNGVETVSNASGSGE
jgi:hypothetical protein